MPPPNDDVETPRRRRDSQGEVREFLTRKAGPLPVYGWGIIAGGLLFGFLYLRNRNAGGAQTLPFDGAYTDPGTDVGSGSGGGGSSGPSYPGAPSVPGSPSTPAPTPPPTAVVPPGNTNPPPVTQPPVNTPPPPQQTPGAGGTGTVLPPIATTPSAPGQDNTSAPGYHAVTDVNGRVWQVPDGAALPPYIKLPGSSGGTTRPANTTINIPQSGLSNPGGWNEITSPGGILRGLEGYTPWAYVNGAWQEYAPGEYSAPGERLGLLPYGVSLPGGRTARPESENIAYWSAA